MRAITTTNEAANGPRRGTDAVRTTDGHSNVIMDRSKNKSLRDINIRRYSDSQVAEPTPTFTPHVVGQCPLQRARLIVI